MGDKPASAKLQFKVTVNLKMKIQSLIPMPMKSP